MGCAVQIAVNFLQVTSVALAINADWSDAIEKTLAVQGMEALEEFPAAILGWTCTLVMKLGYACASTCER